MIKLNNYIIIIILLLPLHRHAYCAIEAFFIKLNKIYLLINFIININNDNISMAILVLLIIQFLLYI